MENIEFFKTQDGSLGLYDKKLDEVFHSKFGAKTEAIEKFINPSKIIDNRPLDILDICYGIGYNTKYALVNFKEINSIDCIEINPNLVVKSIDFSDIKFEKANYIRFFIGDARKVLLKLNKKYDVIFHDAFAPHKQSILWSEEFIYQISKHLKDNGIYCTYNHSLPVLNALHKCNLIIGKTKNNSITASFDKNLIENPLDEFELGKLNTKSAITYKDKNLNKTHDDIIKERNKIMESSDYTTLSSYLKNNHL